MMDEAQAIWLSIHCPNVKRTLKFDMSNVAFRDERMKFSEDDEVHLYAGVLCFECGEHHDVYLGVLPITSYNFAEERNK